MADIQIECWSCDKVNTFTEFVVGEELACQHCGVRGLVTPVGMMQPSGGPKRKPGSWGRLAHRQGQKKTGETQVQSGKQWIYILIVIAVTVGGAYFYRQWKDRPADPADIAKEIVSRTLRSPSTAKWVKVRVVKNQDIKTELGRFYLLYVSVDAQNAYGTEVREYYLVAFCWNKRSDPQAKAYWYSPKNSATKCQPDPTEADVTNAMLAFLEAVKAFNKKHSEQ